LLSQTKARAATVGALVVTGSAASAVIGYVNEAPPRPLVAKHSAALAVDVVLPAPSEDKPGDFNTVVVDEIVIVAPRPTSARRFEATAAKTSPARTCVWHQNVAVASGRVRICDIERATTGQGKQLLTPIDKPTSLGRELDLASPSGLLRASWRSSARPRPAGSPAPNGHTVVSPGR